MTVPVPGSLTYSYDEDGITTVFAYPVRFFEPQELEVVREVGGVRTTLTYNVDYTVSGAGSPSGGSITRAAATDGGKIIITRNTAWKQIVDLTNNGRNPAESVEQQLDRLTMAGQDSYERFSPLADKADDLDDAVARAEAAKAAAEDAQAAAESAAGSNLANADSLAAAMLSNIPGSVNYVRTAGFADAGDGGGALYKKVLSEPTHAGKFQSADGAWWELCEAVVYPEMLGAKGDGVTDNGTLLNDCLEVARVLGTSLVIPCKTYVSDTITVHHKDKIIGVNRFKSVIKASPTIDGRGLIEGVDALSLFNTETYDNNAGSNQVQISSITLEGNGAISAKHQDGILIWGYATNIQDVNIRNFSGVGMRTEWTDGSVSMEGTFRNIVIDTCGQTGWVFNGPHDSHAENIMVIDASQSANYCYAGVFNGKGNGRFFNIHIWHRSTSSNRCEIAFRSNGSNEFVACHFEGCKVQLWHAGNLDRVSGSLIYAPFGNDGDPLVLMEGSSNIHAGCIYSNNGGTTESFAIQFGISGKASVDNIISAGRFIQFWKHSPFNFVNSGGFNVISSCTGYAQGGGKTSFSGSPNVDDRIDYRQTGTNINIQKLHFMESYNDDSEASLAGVPINGMYRTGSQLKIRVE